jgi:hypothetical protein
VPNEQQESSRDEVVEQLKALGYIDPGAGSSLWQVALARLFAITGGLRKFFGRSRTEEEE